MIEEEFIEKFLKHVEKKPTISLFEDCKTILENEVQNIERYKIQELYYTLEVYNIVEKTSSDDPYYMLSKLGRQIIKEGGWVSHLNKLKREEEVRESDRQLAREVSQSVKTTNSNQLIILILTIGISLVSFIVSLLSYFKEEKIMISEPIQVKIIEFTKSNYNLKIIDSNSTFKSIKN